MEATITVVKPAADDVKKIVLRDTLGVYREDYDIYADVDGDRVSLDVMDATVSRKRGGECPIVFELDQRGVLVQNRCNSNPVTVRTGLGSHELGQGHGERVSEACTVEIGLNTTLRISIHDSETNTLSIEELEELGLTQQGPVVQGPSLASHAQLLADNFRHKYSESVQECLALARELCTFVESHPCEDPAYEEVRDELTSIRDHLEMKANSSALRNTDLDAEWEDRIDSAALRVERLYSR